MLPVSEVVVCLISLLDQELLILKILITFAGPIVFSTSNGKYLTGLTSQRACPTQEHAKVASTRPCLPEL